MGGISEQSPLLISDYVDFCSAVNDPSNGGYFEISRDIDVGASAARVEAKVIGSAAGGGGGFNARVVNGKGYRVRLKVNQTVDYAAFFRNTHFKNIVLIIEKGTISGSNFDTWLFDWCGLYNCTILIGSDIFISPYGGFMTGRGVQSKLEPRVMEYTLWGGLDGLALSGGWKDRYSELNLEGFQHNYAFGASKNPYVVGCSGITLAAIDTATGGLFSNAGWAATHSANYASPPSGDDVISAYIRTYDAGGAGCARTLWCEYAGRLNRIGTTDSAGNANITFKVFKGASYSVLAAEDLSSKLAVPGLSVVAGMSYVADYDPDNIYVAQDSGILSSVDGFHSSAAPIIVGGVTFVSAKRYPAASSARHSKALSGVNPQINLTAGAGGGGPVISGDPAYLDGQVEEVHPMTGLRRALANCEVVAFERRGTDYVAMGSAYSDGIGGFRLETQVYGGGDVFAFAADFPGVIFQPGVTLNLGDRIRPALANGYVYEIIEAGTAGASEPVWWPDQGDGTEGDIGTARARARPYYQPVGHGPLKMTPM